MKELLTDFLDWMNEINSTNPMQLETDHDDIAMMYLDSGRAETVVGQVSASSANGETAGHYPEPLTEEEKEICKLFGIQVEQYWAVINTVLENELVALFNNKGDADKFAVGIETFTVKPFAMQLKR